MQEIDDNKSRLREQEQGLKLQMDNLLEQIKRQQQELQEERQRGRTTGAGGG